MFKSCYPDHLSQLGLFMPNTEANMDTGMQIAEWHMEAIKKLASVSGKYDERAVHGCLVALASKIMVALDKLEEKYEKITSDLNPTTDSHSN